jgi:LacI family transcriptional regulator
MRTAKNTQSVSTLKDVARHAGVSFSTASCVLNNKPKSVGSAARERIWLAARELDYRANPLARSLVTKRTHIIGFWISDVSSAFSARLIAEFHKHAKRQGYEMLISEPGECDWLPALKQDSSAENALDHIRQSLSYVDGVIIYTGLASRRMHLGRDLLTQRQVPFVTLGAFPVEGADHVGVDLLPSARSAVTQLVQSGCRRITYLVHATADFTGDARREAYLGVMQSAGLTPHIIATRHSSPLETRAEARATIATYLQSNAPMEGLFCYNDECAIGAYRALRDFGLRVPEDVSIIGCNGIEETKYLDSPLSTLVLPVEEMCATTWNFLEQRLEKPDAPQQQVVLSANLELRQSVRGQTA